MSIKATEPMALLQEIKRRPGAVRASPLWFPDRIDMRRTSIIDPPAIESWRSCRRNSALLLVQRPPLADLTATGFRLPFVRFEPVAFPLLPLDGRQRSGAIYLVSQISSAASGPTKLSYIKLN